MNPGGIESLLSHDFQPELETSTATAIRRINEIIEYAAKNIVDEVGKADVYNAELLQDALDDLLAAKTKARNALLLPYTETLGGF